MLSDHNNIKYFMHTTKLNDRQARYAEELAWYDFEIEYKPGISNPADGISRRLDYARGYKEEGKRESLDAMLPTLRNKLWMMGLEEGSSGATSLNPRVACVSHASDTRDGAKELERSLNHIHTSRHGLIT
jgi:hypothetical protein